MHYFCDSRKIFKTFWRHFSFRVFCYRTHPHDARAQIYRTRGTNMSSSALTSIAHLSSRANNSNAPKPSSSSKSRHQKRRSARCDRIWITTTSASNNINNSNNTNDIINKNNKSSSLSSFGGSSVLEDFDGQKPEIGSTMTRSCSSAPPPRPAAPAGYFS